MTSRSSRNRFGEWLAALRRGELGGLLGDSVYVGAGQAAIAVADLVQITLVTHLLGLEAYGRLAIVISFVALVGQFFDVRVGTAATIFGARRLRQDVPSARGIFQFSYLINLVTGVVAFLVVATVAIVAGQDLVGGDDGALLILVYSAILLVQTFQDSAAAVLRLLDRFRLVGIYTVALQVIRIALVTVALVWFGSLVAVVAALLVVEVLTSAVNLLAASIVFKEASGGVPLTRPGVSAIREERRGMLWMVWHTNIATYGRLAQVQLPTVLLGALVGATQAGIYKIGMAAATGIWLVATPLYNSVLPRLSRLWTAGRAADIRRLIVNASKVIVPVMIVLAFLIAVPFNTTVLRLLGGDEATGGGAQTVLALGAIAQAINGATFWNISVLWATGRSRTAARLTIVTTILQVALLVALVPILEAVGAAIAFCASMVAFNSIAGVIAWRILQQAEASGSVQPSPPVAPT